MRGETKGDKTRQEEGMKDGNAAATRSGESGKNINDRRSDTN